MSQMNHFGRLCPGGRACLIVLFDVSAPCLALALTLEPCLALACLTLAPEAEDTMV